MKAPWGATHYPGQWSINATTRTITGIQGNAGDIELVFVSGPYSSGIPVTNSGAGGSFGTNSTSMPGSTGYPASVGSLIITWRARILTSSDVHSVTADGSSGNLWIPSNTFAFSARRIDVFIIANPMKLAASDLLTMCTSRYYGDPGGVGYGTTVYFSDVSSLKNFGGFRLDYGIVGKQFDNTGMPYSLSSYPNQSFATSDMNGFSNSPYYGTFLDGTNSPNDGITDNSNTAYARTAELVVRYANSSSSTNRWAESNWGTIPYTNKHYHIPSNSYVSLYSYIGAFSFVFPNYDYSRIL